jgi:MSHA pilin protein MshC
MELVCVILIVAVLGASVVARLFDEQDFEQRGYADELASSLRHAQRIAVASECQVRFTINASAYSASLRSSLPNCRTNSGSWSTPLRRSDGTTLSGSPPSGIHSIPAAATLIFEADGRLNAAAPAFAVGPFTINIDRFSGTVTVTP